MSVLRLVPLRRPLLPDRKKKKKHKVHVGFEVGAAKETFFSLTRNRSSAI
jgi:hypothetical protein